MPLSRRDFFTTTASGLGGLALGSLLNPDSVKADTDAPAPGLLPHHAPRAKACIFIFLMGGPSQMDMFDPKPSLHRFEGQPLPDSLIKNHRFAFVKPDGKILPSRYPFSRHGRSGLELSGLLPHLSTVADDLCLIRSMQTNTVNHLPGHIFMNTGRLLAGRPSVGSWLLYGLGSESKDLPGYVVLNSRAQVRGGATNWSNGFLPPSHQGVVFNQEGAPVFNLNRGAGITEEAQRAGLDALADLNRISHQKKQDPQIIGRIKSFELAFRMQSAVPELTDLSGENPRTLAQYGVDRSGREWFPSFVRQPSELTARAFSRNCLLARRMVERGVRFVSIFHGDWDQHFSLHRDLQTNCLGIDQPAAALIRDLKDRGLLDETLVVCMGEFGRTSIAEGSKKDGRGHHPKVFSGFLAGGGVKAGHVHGASDDLCWDVAEDPVHVHDLHATMLHLFGLDHTRLTYRYQGRDFRLTDEFGHVVRPILA